ncbi:glycoside hydrolase family 3 N-terminal domain-containing protein [Cytophagales bacterium LB-30]|uniref:beta-glucosidase n=1 Tax=Shiella aurantiaca TaxID=3058365 RepID=A0ABT8F886_9BACT|nr:glycoside hydrolase family 3 N-terminal domain-containing protein [Shiella aurantiaca]MDN4166690.1 glycoside hydrolase family 3 N-terminal domain-containing protein [Shiella aurantiaca]
MKKRLIPVLLLGLLACESPQPQSDSAVEELLAQMTLEEKVGQLNFVVGDLFNTGPTVRTSESQRFDEAIKKGEITGLFNIHGADYVNRLQRIAVEESRLGIPLLIGADIIHGFKTVFPLSIGEAASWDLAMVEKAAQVAAQESAAVGINLTFAPMVDISRDARWGRTSEGSGEDPYLGSRMAEARVRGFQGKGLADPLTIAACVKHFAAYGAAEAGRDYNTVDISEYELRNTYLPPFKAAIDAGSATLMTAFNELNGVPATAHTLLLQQILQKEWQFEGAVISDWQNIGEMLAHGYVADSAQAAQLALEAGTHVDMMAEIFLRKIPQLVRDGVVKETVLDEAVRKVLQLKMDLGLFDNPYQYGSAEKEKELIRSEAFLKTAREMAERSIVLLKNEGQVLPLKKGKKKVAVIGPLGNNKADMNGSWSFFGEEQHPVTILEGLKAFDTEAEFTYVAGCDLYTNSTEGFAEAVAAARKADVIILAIGESAPMNGEGASRASIHLPGVQEDLVKALHQSGKPMIALVSSGRPLVLNWLHENVPAVLAMWTLGSETGHAVANVLYGNYNPSGKLPMSFPRAEGQLPLYYNHKQTGRMYTGDHSEPGSERVYRSRYRDVPNSPLYPFGYGLSYTTFEYSDFTIDKQTISLADSVKLSVTVRNSGTLAGEEVVQWYIRDEVGSITRPVKELKGFEKISLAPGESKTLSLHLSADDLAFWRADMTFGAEPGSFQVFVGGNSRDVLNQSFTLSPQP